MQQFLRRLAAGSLLVGAIASQAAAPEPDTIESTAHNLLVVLRETPGANKQQEGLLPFGKISARLPDGRDHEFEASWFQYLGDLHLRIVFDGLRQVRSAVPDDLHKLALSPEQALDRAVANIRSRYGPPVAVPWAGGLMIVDGPVPELTSSYLLDRTFWNAQARGHAQGLLVAVPRRGELLFGPADDALVRMNLQFTTAARYAADERNRLSSALYLFKDGRWSVDQAPQAPIR
jgi:hypothetical protein